MSTAMPRGDVGRLLSHSRHGGTSSSYRPDIDGLRAIAVALVLLFHASLGFPGGFVGVDIFFVISGFLITNLILKSLDSGTFSLTDFWVRRIKRILPAAWVMVVVVLCAGLVLLVPSDYDSLAQSAIAQQIMLANVYFWKHTGYFAGAAELLPLLHTWSLAVEEQFYLGYPILLIILNRCGRSVMSVVLVLLTVASFVMSVHGVHHHPSATFFFLPTRAWEMSLGGLLCFVPPPARLPRLLAELVGWSALAAMLGASLAFTAATPFPGAAALLPCVAAAVLIWTNAACSTSVARLLAAKPVVFVGLISYSLYLWHWPLFAFSRYWHDAELPVATRWLLLAATAIAATLSWRFVEVPCRNGRNSQSPARVFGVAALALGCALLCAGLIVWHRGLHWRASPEVQRYHLTASSDPYRHEISIDQAERGDFPVLGDPNGPMSCILWGDSHAMAVMAGLDAACKSLGFRAYQATHSSTPPVLNMVYASQFGLNRLAPQFNAATLNFIRTKRIPVVFLSGRWANYAKLDGFAEHLRRTIYEVNAAGACVGVVLDVADQKIDVPRHYARRAFWSLPLLFHGISKNEHTETNQLAEAIIREVCASSDRAIIVDPAEQLVDSSGIWFVAADGGLIYRDSHHLSVEGSLLLNVLFERFLEALLGVREDSAGCAPRPSTLYSRCLTRVQSHVD